jgi:hypothetical protein
MYGKRKLRKIRGRKSGDVPGDRGNYTLKSCLLSALRLNKYEMARHKMKLTYKILVGEPCGKRPLWRLRLTRKYNIRSDRWKMDSELVNWCEVSWSKVQ